MFRISFSEILGDPEESYQFHEIIEVRVSYKPNNRYNFVGCFEEFMFLRRIVNSKLQFMSGKTGGRIFEIYLKNW